MTIRFPCLYYTEVENIDFDLELDLKKVLSLVIFASSAISTSALVEWVAEQNRSCKHATGH